MKLTLNLLSLLLCSCTLFSQTTLPNDLHNDPLQVKTVVLENGLTVMLSENHNSAHIFGCVAVKAGGKNDPKDATGMAHYLEHMLFKGTETMGTYDFDKEKIYLDQIKALYEELGKTNVESERAAIQKKINEAAVKAGEYAIPNEMDRLLSEIGSTKVNAFTTEDFTAYFNEFPANKLDQWLQIYDHRFEKPVFRLFQSELETVYEEKNRGMDSPFNSAFEFFAENFWKNHPYGQQTIIGSTEHLKNPSLEKMYAYFNSYYVANNMILSLSGDFNTDEALVLIQKYFGDWRSGTVPVFPKYEEKEFKGKESISIRATPIKAFVRGYRTPKNGDSDQQKVQLLHLLLSNKEGSGLLDQLNNTGKLAFSGIIPMEYNDYSASILFAVPKIVGQSFSKAELLIDEILEQLRTGNFSDDLFLGAKLSLQKEFEKEIENNQSRVLLMVNSFTSNSDWLNYLKNFKSIQSFTKEEIVETANRYFGSNFLALYSKMGKGKKNKLGKPGFEPVIPVDGKVSVFTEKWRQTPTSNLKPRFVDFSKDLTQSNLATNVELASVKNPMNALFNLELKWGKGIQSDQKIAYLANYLNKLGTDSLSTNTFKEKMFTLGSSMYFEANKTELILNIEGLDQNFAKTVDLVNDFLQHFKGDEKSVAAMLEEEKSARKLNYNDLNYKLQAVTQFALFEEKSSNLQEFTFAELGKLTASELKSLFNEVQQFALKMNYVGSLSHDQVAAIVKSRLILSDKIYPKTELQIFEMKGFESNKVYFLNDKNAVQSQLMFLVQGNPLKLDDIGESEAFNLYFGGDMSSLVFQEIREYRSLAYSTWAKYQLASRVGKPSLFSAYVGCQGDKTLDAIEAMNELIRNMPLKSDREAAIRSSLISESKSAFPGFRTLLNTVEKWEELGLNEDPNKNLLAYYNDLTFEQIVQFYDKQLRGKNIQLLIVGNSKKIDMKALSKFGEVILLNEKQVIVK